MPAVNTNFHLFCVYAKAELGSTHTHDETPKEIQIHVSHAKHKHEHTRALLPVPVRGGSSDESDTAVPLRECLCRPHRAATCTTMRDQRGRCSR